MESLILDVQATARSFGENAQATVERAVASTDRRFSVCPAALAIPTQGPMDSFSATTWPACYVEWWFGDGAPGLHRDRAIRAAISRRGFDADLNVLASVSSQDFMEAVITARSLRHATFIRAILTIVRAWHREQHHF